MKQKIKCLNISCPSMKDGNQHVIKAGKKFLRTKKVYVQRYECMRCKKTFTPCKSKNVIPERILKEEREQGRKVQQLICSGMTYRSISKFMEVSRPVIEKRIKEIAKISKETYSNYKSFKYEEGLIPQSEGDVKLGYKPKLRVPILVFDEMETHLISSIMPLSIGIGYDSYNDKIISIRVCGFAPRKPVPPFKMVKGKSVDFKEYYEDNHDFDFIDHRKQMATDIFMDMFEYSKDSLTKDRTIITDGKTNYPLDIASAFGIVKYSHIILKTKGGSSSDDTEDPDMLDESLLLKDPEDLRNRSYFQKLVRDKVAKFHHVSAFAKFNKVCAVLRMNLAPLHRRSFCNIKSIADFQKLLYVFQDWYNTRKLTNEELKAKGKRLKKSLAKKDLKRLITKAIDQGISNS